MKKIGILHISSDLNLAGAQKILVDMIKVMPREKFSAAVFSLKDGELRARLQADNIPVRVAGCFSALSFRAISEIRDFIKACNPDIIHCHGFHSAYYGAIAAGLTGRRLVLHYHGRYCLEKLSRRVISFFACRMADRVVSVSGDLKTALMRSLFVPGKKLEVLHNGIEPADFSYRPEAAMSIRKELCLRDNAVLVGTVANLLPVKGQIYLLDAAKIILARFPEVKFIIVGDGELRAALERKAVESGIRSAVIFAGRRRDIADILAAMDIFVMPSLSEEISLALLEAMAMRKPVVATRAGGNPEIIEDNINGLLVRPKNSADIAESVILLLADPRKAERLGVNARDRVETAFNLKNMAARLQTIYEQILNEDR